MKTVDEIIIVADRSKERYIKPFQREDLLLIKKHYELINSTIGDTKIPEGFYKIRVSFYFFGLVKRVTLEKLKMQV